MQITPEQMQQKFETLPEGLKWAIMAANIDDHIIDIGQKENLTVEQMGQLSLETHLVVLGFIPPEKFEDSIGKSLGLPKEKTKVLADTVNEKILKVIRTHMQEAFEKKSESLLIPEEPTPPPSLPIEKGGESSSGLETREEMLAALEKPEPELAPLPQAPFVPKPPESKPPIFAQKLSGPVQMAPVKTVHEEKTPEESSPQKSATPTAPKKYSVDPYREIPE